MLFRVLAVAAAAIALAPLTVEAESIYQNQGPAELPTASFKGNQFVDSSGCIFVRAGFGNQTSWVPRVTRDRRVMCGFKPSFAASKTRPVQGGGMTLAMPLAKPKPIPETTPPKPLKIVSSRPPETKTPATTGLPMTTIAGSVSAATATSQRGPVPLAPPVPQSPRASTGTQYATATPPVRAPSNKIYTAQTTGAPSFLAVRPQTDVPPVPKGYVAAWTDGRLNPQRGPRTAEGDQQMNLVWTRTVPRRLVNTKTMKAVTAQYPKLSYPVTAQPPAPTGATAAVPEGYRPVQLASAAPQQVTLSTSNQAAAHAPVVTKPRAAVAHGDYVQVGLFGVPSNATHTVARLQAMGLPVWVTSIRSHGKLLRSVMAGPFASPAQVSAALVTARRAGFSDAYIR